jgi:hypothetical protein
LNCPCLAGFELPADIWTKTDANTDIISFISTNPGTRIKYHEAIAIYVKGGGYLKYGERSYGINLVWSKTPVYEWEITGDKIGDEVQSGVKVGLYNRFIKNHVVYCARPYGINLKWAKDCK